MQHTATLLVCRQEATHKSTEDTATCHASGAAAQAPPYGPQETSGREEARGGRRVRQAARPEDEGGKGEEDRAASIRLCIQEQDRVGFFAWQEVKEL